MSQLVSVSEYGVSQMWYGTVRIKCDVDLQFRKTGQVTCTVVPSHLVLLNTYNLRSEGEDGQLVTWNYVYRNALETVIAMAGYAPLLRLLLEDILNVTDLLLLVSIKTDAIF